jgi:hypothetical protein
MLTFLSKAAVDLYYIGFFDAAATYNSGTGRELRHSLGTRFFENQPVGPGMLDWNWPTVLLAAKTYGKGLLKTRHFRRFWHF